MAIVINHNPADYSSIHGDLIFTVYEATKAVDPVTYPNYKYVCDVYIGGVLEKRLTTFPRPDNSRGVFNIGPIVRNYISQQFAPDENILCQEFGAGEFYLDVQCKFGEEISYTTTTNLTVDSTRRYFNHYNGRITEYETIRASAVFTQPTTRPAQLNIQRDSIYYFIPYIPPSTSVTVRVKTYNASGTLVDDDTDTGSFSAESGIQFNFSPYCISYNLSFDFTLIDHYTVEIQGSYGRTYTFKIKDECIHTPYTIHFLNKFGLFESFEFRKISRKIWDVEKKSFTQNPFRISSAGLVEYGATTALGIVGYESKTVYASKFREKMKLSADNLTDAEWAWLKELQFSPLVYLQEGDNIIPVTVEGTQYEEKKYVNDKLQSLQIDIDFGVQLNAQFR
jgi:hypothetical protein